MKRRTRHKKILIFILLISFFSFGYYGANQFITKYIPDEMKIRVGELEQFEFNVPFDAKIYSEKEGVLRINQSNVPANEITLSLREPFSIQSNEVGNYKVELSLFGIIPLKQVSLDVIDEKHLIPGGLPVGIVVETKGVMVLGTGVIIGEDGNNYEPSKNIIQSGDYIVDLNGNPLNSKEELVQFLLDNGADEVKLGVRRAEEYVELFVKPIKSSTLNEYKIGIWVRDDTQGIGTITYIDGENSFGALGHGITDIDTKQLMDVETGEVFETEIINIVKGQKGAPGELSGLINYDNDKKMGTIRKNTEYGVFGEVYSNVFDQINKNAIPIGLKHEVKEGLAYIRSSLSGEMKDYKIMIKNVDISNNQINKGMIIEVIDEELLSQTNGIVQGMSGSPIIQDNKIIGAVTHVFVQDSTKGYGTFIENMLRSSK